MKRLAPWILAGSAALAMACGGPTESTDSTGPAPTLEGGTLDIVPAGKADDYFSDVSAEFQASGTVTVEMMPEEFADERTRDEIVAKRVSAVGVYLTTYVTDKFRGIDINGDGEIGDDEVFFQNEEYGGFQAMVRNRSVELLEVDGVDGVYEAGFSIDLAGPPALLDLLAADGAEWNGEGVSVAVPMPAGSTTDRDGGPIRSFDPDTYEGELEEVPLNIVPLPEVGDAYPHYQKFFAKDGVYDITLWYGHDYNTPRQDLLDAQRGFDALLEMGFTAPDGVETFEDLGPDSGPFVTFIYTFRPSGEACIDDEILAAFNDPLATVEDFDEFYELRSDAAENAIAWRAGEDGTYGTIDDRRFHSLEDVEAINGIGPVTMQNLSDFFVESCELEHKQVRMEVRMFHSDMYETDRDEHKRRAIYEMTARDVFFYNGHAGPYYGFYMDADYDAYIDDEEFLDIPFDPERQRLFIAQGCQTYSQYADMLYANPHLSEDNLDVITTVNYSYAQGTMNLLQRLTLTDEGSGIHIPVTYGAMIRGLNSEYWNQEKSVFYGVIGIDQNPSMHPHAKPETVGNSCTEHAECGYSTLGGWCAEFGDGSRGCVSITSDASACPAGSSFTQVANGDTITGGACY